MGEVYTREGRRTTVYRIRDAEGRPIADKHRVDMPDGNKECFWRRPSGEWGLNGTPLAGLPLYGSEQVSTWPEDALVVLVEGEKARDALDQTGAFCALGTVTGASVIPGREALEVLRGRRVVLWPDNDEGGLEHMGGVAEALQGIAAEVLIYSWDEAPEKGDAADHPLISQGPRKALDKLLTDLEGAPRWKPTALRRTRTAAELLEEEIPPARWAVPEILPEGVTLLAGKPKLGKSWLALGLCVATATGGYALGKKRVEKGEALYLALEDNKRRLQKRLKKLLHSGAAPKGFHYALEWPRLSEGGVEELREWLSGHPQARLIVIDTLAKIRKPAKGQNVYAEDYGALEKLLPLAAEYGVAILVVHHLRKMAAGDPMDEISGSTGLSGGVDGFLILKRDRGRHDAALHVDGRDVEEPAELALKWDALLASWTLVGDAAEYRMSNERIEILGLLREAAPNPMRAKEIAPLVDKSPNAVSQTLYQMLHAGQVGSPSRGLYTIPKDPKDPKNNKDPKDPKDARPLEDSRIPKTAPKEESPIDKSNSADSYPFSVFRAREDPSSGGSNGPAVTPRDESLTEEQAVRMRRLQREGMSEAWARRTVLAGDHPLDCECEVCL